MKMKLKKDILSHLIEVAEKEEKEFDHSKFFPTVNYLCLNNFIRIDDIDVLRAETVVRKYSSGKRLKKDLWQVSVKKNDGYGVFQNENDESKNPFMDRFARGCSSQVTSGRRSFSWEKRNQIWKEFESMFADEVNVQQVLTYLITPLILEQRLKTWTEMNNKHLEDMKSALSGVKDIREIQYSDLPKRCGQNTFRRHF